MVTSHHRDKPEQALHMQVVSVKLFSIGYIYALPFANFEYLVHAAVHAIYSNFTGLYWSHSQTREKQEQQINYIDNTSCL